MSDTKEFVIDAERTRLFNWRELAQYKELFYFFTWRDIKIKYKQTVLGFLWAVLQPLFMMLIFTLFFGRALNISSGNLPYPVFVFSGLLIWNAFSTGLTGASNSMVNNAMIIKKIYFPRLVIPGSAILVASFDFLMALIVFAGILIWFGQPVALSAFYLWPLALVLVCISTLGPGTLLAALNVKYRDFRYVIPFLIQILFFVTPVIYPVSMLDEPILKYVVAMSPAYAAVELFRIPLTQTLTDLTMLSLSIGSSLFWLICGLVYFKNTEEFFADLA